MKRIVLLGASGSIGQQTIDILKSHHHKFQLIAFSVGHNIDYARVILKDFQVKAVYIIEENHAISLKKEFPYIDIYYADQLDEFVRAQDADLLVNALMGFVGLKPTMTAIESGMDIAIANKETLVAGGDLVLDHAKHYGVNLIPVDSEHSAIFQCLEGFDAKDLESITITASGGSFRDLTREELKSVSKEDALNHPNWSMGAKITIDSATMMNKGLEVIEAHYLFDLPYSNIKVLQHDESIIHSFISFKDTSSIAQMGPSDMRVAIQYALTYPRHICLKNAKDFDLAEIATLNFKTLSFERFPLLKLAYDVGARKGNLPIVMNSANEIAVELFLKDKISFLDIETLVIETVNNARYLAVEKLDDVLVIDKITRDFVLNYYQAIIKGEASWDLLNQSFTLL